MKCPHCLIDFHEDQTRWSVSLADDAEGWWVLERRTCPACRRFIMFLDNGPSIADQQRSQMGQGVQHVRIQVGRRDHLMIWPRGISRAPVPPEVPAGIVEDYKEACLVLGDSAKANR
jgi:hypothetical protein